MANLTFDRITVEPSKCGGKPCIRGMRIAVRRVLEIMATHRDRDEILREYPFLEEQEEALRYAAASVDEELANLNRPFHRGRSGSSGRLLDPASAR